MANKDMKKYCTLGVLKEIQSKLLGKRSIALNAYIEKTNTEIKFTNYTTVGLW